MNAQRAFTYIEILISLFILAVMILVVMATALNSLKAVDDSFLQSVAAEQVISLAEELRANQSLSARLLVCQQWEQVNHDMLPQAKGECRCQTGSCQIQLHWRDHVQTLMVDLS